MGSIGKQLLSFFLGALVPAVFLFILASDRLAGRLSSLGYGAMPIGHAPGANHTTGISALHEEKEKFLGLAELLPKVAMEDRTVIITSVNEAWARPGSLLDLYRDGFKNGKGTKHLLNHVLVVAADHAGFDRCNAIHPHCFLLEVKSISVSSANRFMSKSYLEIVWAKLSFQQRVLELGYNFLFTDCDVVWFRDPFQHISVYADMAISCDGFTGDANDQRNAPNTGFYYVKSSNRTVEMLKHWQAARSRFPATNHDQHIFAKIKGEIVDKLQVRIVFLDTAFIGGFCQYHDDMDRVCTMHANCCIGLENKVHDLKNVIADWKNYTSLPATEKKSGRFRWTRPAKCLASIGRH